MRDKSIQDRINASIDKLILLAEEAQHICKGDQCENHISNVCRGTKGCVDGSCHCKGAVEYDAAGNLIP